MLFSCSKCRTKYKIPDAKVAGKVLKIRCKTCGAVVVVRDPSLKQGAAGTTQPGTAGHLKAAPEPTWFAAVDGQQQGPMSFANLVGLVNGGKVQGETYVWRAGMPDWVRARTMPDLAPLIEAVASMPPPPPGAITAETPQAQSDAVARARFAAERRAREARQQEAAEKARRERLAAEKARREREALEKARREREALEKARREREAAEKARREREAAEKARREREAAEKARREREAAEKARREREALEKAKRAAEAKAKREAEDKARREAEARARQEAKARAAARPTAEYGASDNVDFAMPRPDGRGIEPLPALSDLDATVADEPMPDELAHLVAPAPSPEPAPARREPPQVVASAAPAQAPSPPPPVSLPPVPSTAPVAVVSPDAALEPAPALPSVMGAEPAGAPPPEEISDGLTELDFFVDELPVDTPSVGITSEELYLAYDEELPDEPVPGPSKADKIELKQAMKEATAALDGLELMNRQSKQERAELREEFSILIRMDKARGRRTLLFLAAGVLVLAGVAGAILVVEGQAETRNEENRAEYRAAIDRYTPGGVTRGKYDVPIVADPVRPSAGERVGQPATAALEAVGIEPKDGKKRRAGGKTKKGTRKNGTSKNGTSKNGAPEEDDLVVAAAAAAAAAAQREDELKEQDEKKVWSKERFDTVVREQDGKKERYIGNWILAAAAAVEAEAKAAATVAADEVAEAVGGAFAKKKRQLAKCKDNREEKLQVVFTVTPMGRVVKATVTGTSSPVKSRCIQDILNRAVFPSASTSKRYRQIITL